MLRMEFKVHISLVFFVFASGFGNERNAMTTSYASKNTNDSAGTDFNVISTNPDDVRFFLYSDPSQTNKSDEIVFNNSESLKSSPFDLAKPVKFLIHGFLGNGRSTGGFPENVKNGYLEKNDEHSYNIIAVDWAPLATPSAGPLSLFLYTTVVENVERVGQRVGHFIEWLHESYGLKLNSVHLVAHSLGCHVSGWAGDTVDNGTGKQIGRISGEILPVVLITHSMFMRVALDPAGPSFYTDIPTRQIKPFDAQFIDVYHTSSGLAGLPTSVGHVDFYVNGGIAPQPGCFPEILGCSHSRAHEYFAQSITLDDPATLTDPRVCVCVSPVKFILSPDCCDRRFLFGEYCEPGTVGNYFVRYPRS